MTDKCKFRWVLRVKNAKFSGFLPNLRTKVLNMKKTSVLVLLSGLFDRSRSRTVTALVRGSIFARHVLMDFLLAETQRLAASGS